MPTPINNLIDAHISYGTPKEGPRALPYLLDFTASGSSGAPYLVDVGLLYDNGKLTRVLTAYVDNSLNSSNLTIQFANTMFGNMTFKIPPYGQGFIPFPAGNVRAFTVSTNGSFVIPITLLNYPVPPEVWSTNGSPTVNGDGSINVKDATLESAVSAGFFQSKGFLVYGDGTTQPEFVGSKIITGTLTVTTAVNLFTGTSGWVLKSLKVQLSGDATLAVAGQVNVSALENTTVLTNGRAFLGTTAPTNLTLPTTLIDLSSITVTSKVANSGFQLQANVVPNAGELRYTATYGLTSFVGG